MVDLLVNLLLEDTKESDISESGTYTVAILVKKKNDLYGRELFHTSEKFGRKSKQCILYINVIYLYKNSWTIR